MKEEKRNKWKIISLVGILVILLVLLTVWTYKNTNQTGSITPELARAMNYAQFEEGDDAVEGTDNVKFSAFFLRDINKDGYAEKIKGTCKKIGESDVLYMEINVQTAGFLKDAKIQVNGKNFYLQTALPEDDELKTNYIGNNIKTIEFNQLANGTQKLLTGIVKSGDYSYTSSMASAIGNNINNYSREDNEITLTGTYVDQEGNETPITKKVDLSMDWYGTVKASIYDTYQGYSTLNNNIDEENKIIKLNFSVNPQETERKLNISKSYVEGVIPKLNEYTPVEVKLVGNSAKFTYDEETGKFTIQKEATTDNAGLITDGISSSTYYNIQVTYPLEAYQTLGTEMVELRIPVEAYFEGYNNQNTEFKNPYLSNTAKATIVANYHNPQPKYTKFDVTIGKYISSPSWRYIVSKQKPKKIYNGISESEKDDTYLVTWYAYTGTDAPVEGIIMKETKTGEAQEGDKFIKSDSTTESMENVTRNIGIYFSNATSILGEDGWIKVYNDETDELLITFDKTNLSKYTSSNPYKYQTPVKHIRVETSQTTNENSLYVYNIKELDDDYITTNYTEEEFDNLQYIKSTLVGYLGENYIGGDTERAYYEEPYSVANVSISKNVISTQKTEENEIITIQAAGNESYNQVKWENGSFLVKLPTEIITAEINSVTINNSNVQISSYELINKDGNKFIKINTKNTTEQSYNITIDLNLTPDPRISSTSKSIELYASNEASTDYYYKANDIYDVNDNLNTEEMVNKTSTSISLISPNSLLTSQTASNYDEKGSSIISPEIADIKPAYSVVDKEENTAEIGVQIKNNYTSTISNIAILGKIPFEGNTYVISGKDLGSNFTTKMTSDGVQIPEELREKVIVYYSENENPGKEIENTDNGWKVAEEVTNWDNIKTFLIDFNDDFAMEIEKEYAFKYTVKIPNGLKFNQVAFSHHGVFFNLDTEQGKYKTQTEPNKLGFRIAEKYNLELTKYQTGKDKLVKGATYRIIEEGQEEGKTAVTDAEGKFVVNNLYAEKTYTIQEIKSPSDYELSEEAIKFIGHVDNSGNLSIEKLEGTTKEDIKVEKKEGEEYKTIVKVEDEAKAKLKITKKEQGTDTLIKGVKYKITGAGLPDKGRTVTTNANGEVSTRGLKVNEEYILQEVKAEGYYLASQIKFKIVNNDGTYELQIVEGEVKESSLIEEDGFPIANIILEDEKIPTYSLEITKIKKTINVNANENEQIAKAEQKISTEAQIETLAGAKFELYKDNKDIGEYITGEDGKIVINNLYQYVEGKDENATYTLKEVLAPVGYAKVKDITFKVQEVNGDLQFQAEDNKERSYTSEGNVLKLQIADSPAFKLIKKDKETQEIIPNVKFAIYNVDDGEQPARNSKGEILGTQEVINGKEYYTLTTNESGEITADLQEGLYKAVEVQAPDKYDISNQVYYFGIGASREVEKRLAAKQVMSVGGSSSDYIYSVAETSDGGIIAGGYFTSGTIQVGNETLTNANAGKYDGMIIKYTSEGEVEWARSIGGSGSDYIYSVAETSDGGIIAGGEFSSTIQVGNETLTNAGSTDGMIIKYTSEGEVEWARSIGGSYEDCIQSVAETSDGGIIAGGNFYSSTIQVGNETLTNAGGSDGMIIKYTSEGEVEWARSIGGSSYDYIYSVAETSDGGIIAGGYFYSSTIQVGNETLTNARSSSYDGMIIKYTSEGEVEWARSIGGSYDDRITSVAETSDGGIIAGGSFSWRIQVGNETLTNAGGSDGMIIKYTSEGEVEWARSIGGSSYDYIYSVAETSDGGIIAGGYFYSSTIQVGNETLTNARSSSYDGMIIKYTSEGEVEWARSIGGSREDYIQSVSETSDGGIIAGGYFYSSTIQVGNETLTNAGSTDGMIIKYEREEIPNIVVKQARSIGGSKEDKITSISETSDGGIIAGGYFDSSTIQVGNETLTNTNTNLDYADGMIIKYTSEGEVEWARSIGGSYEDCIQSVAETSDGGIIAGGEFGSTIQVGNETLTNAGSTDGMIIKYTSEGEVEWARSIGGSYEDCIQSVAETSDGGIIAGGNFYSSTIQVGNETLTNAGNYDVMIIKYTSEGEVEWARSIGGSRYDYIQSVVETSDGGIIAGGYFSSSTIQVGNETLTPAYAGNSDGMIIKYTSEGEVEWARSIGGSSYIYSVAETSDGGIIAGGNFSSSTIQVGNETLTNAGSSYWDGMIIKYTSEGEVEWARSIGGSRDDYIQSVSETSDGGIIAGGYFNSSTIQVGNETLTNAGNYDGMIIKYTSEGKVEWARSIGGSSEDQITSVVETSDGETIAGGYFKSSTIQERNETLTNAGDSDGMIIKCIRESGVPEVQEVISENVRKEYKVTTDIKEIDGTKGGSISGEDKNPYEKIKYGDSNTKEIKMTPDENYEIISITVNGEEYKFEPLEDGTYTMPTFTNITEDKHIEVTYSLKDNKITINKVDAETKEPLSGAKFKLDQIEERSNPEGVIGALEANGASYDNVDRENKETLDINLINNGAEYAQIDETNEISDVLGTLTNNGTYYFVEESGTYIPTNSKTYQTANGGTSGIGSVTANSYIPIDLSSKTGTYVVKLNAQVSSESNYDYGYATVTETVSAPSYSTGTGRFMYISGNVSAKDYISMALQGGKTYYLHLGYKKDGSGDSGEDKVTINSVKVYGANATTYNFNKTEGKYIPDNTSVINTVANSYIPIDLSSKTGKYAILVNAETQISGSSEYLYATVTENTTAPAYNSSTNQFMKITGTQTAKDYVKYLDAGKIYYLHLGYKNDSSLTNTAVINSIELYQANLITYNFIENEGKYESNNQAMNNTVANSYIPIDLTNNTGKYNLIVNAAISSESYDYGYATITETTTAPSYSTSTGRIIYISGTKEAQDYSTVLQGGKMYYLHLGYYKNASTSSGDDKFTVNSVQLTLNDSELYHTEVTTNNEGQAITQIPFGKYSVTEIQAPEGYELNETPTIIEFRADQNHEFEIENQKQARIIVHHYIKETTTKLVEDEVITGKIGEKYTTTPQLDLQKYELEENSEGKYIIPENAVGTYESGDHEVTYYYVEKSIPLTVHHYIEGTQNKVPLLDGNEAEDVTTEGMEGENYTTSAISEDELSKQYELATTPENTTGTYSGEEVIVTYYYKKVERNLVLTKYQEDGTTPLEGAKFTIEVKETPEDVENTESKQPNIYTTDTEGKITTTLEAGEYVITEVEAPEGYVLPENPATEVAITKTTEEAQISLTNMRKQGTVVVHHYIEGTTDKVLLQNGNLAEDETKTGAIGDIYVTKEIDNLSNKYELVGLPENSSGTITEETTEITYYYRLKDGKVTVHHYKENTTESISKDITKIEKVDSQYTTEIATDIPANYELVELPQNATGTITVEDIEVIYYYKLKTPSIETLKITNISTTEKITEVGQKIPYTITYTADIDQYIGNGVVTIVDQLPYEIDTAEEKSSLDGGTYDEINKTITWTEDMTGLDTFANGKKQISITKNIEITYKNLDVTKDTVMNTATGIIKLNTPEKEDIVTATKVMQAEFLINIKAINVWQDNEEQALKRPQSVILAVKNGDIEVTRQEINAENQEGEDTSKWSYTFTGIDKYDESGNEISYTVDELEKQENDLYFYAKTIGKMIGTGDNKEITITNTFTKPGNKITITVNKVWTDRENIYEKRPDSLNLKINNMTTGEEVANKTISVETESSYTFTNLEKYDENGNEIIYTADESEVKEGDLFHYTKHVGNLEDIEEKIDQKQITITNTMTKIPGNVIVKYVDKVSGIEILDTVVKEGIVGESFDISEDKKDILGYTLIEEPTEKTGTYTEEDQVKTYYYAKNTKVIVKYLEKGTNEILTEEAQYEIDGYEGKEYKTEQKEILGYTFIESTNNTQGVMGRETIEIIYYYAKDTKVIVKYLEKSTNTAITEEQQYEISGYEGKEYETEQKEILGYTFIESTNNTQGNMTKEEIEVIYYYAKNTKVIVKYLEKDTDLVLTEEQQYEITGYEGKEYETEQKEILGYTFIESTNNTKGNMTKDEMQVIYYYAQNTKATVLHKDKLTGEILKQETKDGKVGDIFETHAEDIENYVLVERPDKEEVVMTKEEQIVEYYYVHISKGVIEKHIDDITGEIIYTESYEGNEGDEYNISSRTFEGYDLVESKLPENAQGKMTKDAIDVKYYYIRKASVKVEYIDKLTGDKIVEDVIIEGHEKEEYTAEEKQFEGYILEATPENATGEMKVTKNEDGSYNTETLVQYYYRKQSEGVLEKHIDISSNEVLAYEQHEGKVGDEYDILPKEFENYELVETDNEGNSKLPTNSKGNMEDSLIEVNYYYIKKLKVTVEYVDMQTGKIIESYEIVGKEGDEYEAEDKQFDGYNLEEIPDNKKGKITDSLIVVKYYYNRRAEIEVKYLEKDTEIPLLESENIVGIIGDKYDTNQEEIPYYKFVESTDNVKGTMEKDKITVIYYYEKQIFNLKVDKWISNVMVDGISQGGKTIDTKDELFKTDIHRKKILTSDVRVTYKIRVTNDGEIEGSTDKLTEVIPSGYSFYEEDNDILWENNDGILTTTVLKGQTIKPGEFKEVEIALRWNNAEDNFGQKDNIVVLEQMHNPAGYQDINKEDNKSKASMLIAVATGLDKNSRIVVMGIVQIVFVVCMVLLIVCKKRGNVPKDVA